MMPPARVYGRVTIKEPEKPKPDEVSEALREIVSLFDFAVSAAKIDAGIASGLYKGHPKPRRCSVSVGQGRLCGLPLRTVEVSSCTFHKATDRFANLKIKPDEIYAGTSLEPVLRARAAALKPA